MDARTLRTAFDGVYAIGDVNAIVLANGKPLPKAGVFAHAQARVVAREVAATFGAAQAAPFDGKGYCWVELGGGRPLALGQRAVRALLDRGRDRARPRARGIARWREDVRPRGDALSKRGHRGGREVIASKLVEETNEGAAALRGEGRERTIGELTDLPSRCS